jgi:hypothetical protein
MPLKNTTPVISTVHDVIYELHAEGMADQVRIKNMMKPFVKRCIRSYIVFCSEYSAKEFCLKHYGYPMERVKVIGWGVDKKYAPFVQPKHLSTLRPYF